MDLTEAEDIKERWQEYTDELYRKDLHDPDNHKGNHSTKGNASTRAKHPGLQSQVEWTLGSITRKLVEEI